LRPGLARGPELEMRGLRPREGPGAEQRAPEVRAAAARAADDALRRALERRAAGGQDTGLAQHLRPGRGRAAEQLVTGRAGEGAAPVRADLRADAQAAQEREGAPRGRGAREVEVHRELAVTAEMPRAGGVEERRELGEGATASVRRDRRELV